MNTRVKDDKAIAEAKERITQEFVNKYYEFLEDVPNGGSKEFGKKYGILLTDEGIAHHKKDTMKNFLWYQQNIFTGRYIHGWEEAGYSKCVIWDLYHDGFFAYTYYSNYRARSTGRSEWYYIPQRVAKEIYKANKRA